MNREEMLDDDQRSVGVIAWLAAGVVVSCIVFGAILAAVL